MPINTSWGSDPAERYWIWMRTARARENLPRIRLHNLRQLALSCRRRSNLKC